MSKPCEHLIFWKVAANHHNLGAITKWNFALSLFGGLDAVCIKLREVHALSEGTGVEPIHPFALVPVAFSTLQGSPTLVEMVLAYLPLLFQDVHTVGLGTFFLRVPYLHMRFVSPQRPFLFFYIRPPVTLD